MNKKIIRSRRISRPRKKTIDSAGVGASVGALGPETSPELTDEQMAALSGLLLKATGHRFEYYKKTVVARRLARRMEMLGARSVDEYIASLFKNTAEIAHLVNDLMIGVTGFFRDPESWKTLEKEVIRPLVIEEPLNRPLRVWAPACSTGEEAYTIAMAFQRQMERTGKTRTLNVFATDINDKALSRGRQGVYPAGVIAGMPSEFMRRYFTRLDGGARARINKNVRDAVVFAKQNILTDPPFSRLDLIVCRNLFIYLDASAQEKLIGLFHYALRPGGFLFLGGAESVGGRHGFFKPLPGKNCKIYKRTGRDGHSGTAFSFEPSLFRRDGTRAGKAPLKCDHAIEAIAQKALLEKYAPAAVVITASQEILYYNGPTADYLAQPGGAPTHNILDLIPENMRNRMRRLISRSVHENRPAMLSMAFAGKGKDIHKVFVEVRPLDRTLESEPLFCIAFSEQNAKTAPTETIPDSCGPDETLIRQLELELANTRDELLTNVEQEKSLNEELHSSNEELQAANEEMETSREELQTLNEELITANSQLQHALAEQEKAEERLAEREMKFRGIFENSNDAIILLDAASGAYIDCNPMTEKMSGYSREEILSMKAGGLITAPHKEEVTANMEALRSGKTLRGDTELLAKNGAIVPAEFSSSLFAIGNKPCVLSVLRDVAQRKKAEEALRASEGKYRSIVETAQEGIVIATPDGIFEFVNQRMADIVGYAREELIGKNSSIVLDPRQEDIVAKSRTELRQGGNVSKEYKLRKKDGSAVWTLTNASPLFDGKGRHIGNLGMHSDITERKRAEEALQTALLRLQTLVSSMHGSILFVGENMVELANQNFCDYFGLQDHPGDLIGLSPAEMIEKIKNAYLNPDEQVSRIHEIVALGQPVIGEEINLTGMRTCLRDFIPITMGGKPSGRLWYHVDISHRKRAEEELRASQKRTEAILEGIADTFYSLDDQWRFTVVNPAAERAPFGRPAAELLGKVIWDMYPNLVGTPIHRHYINAAGKHSLEHYTAQSPINARWYEVFMQGWNGGVDVCMRDITERKQAEEALRQSEERFKAIAETTPVGIGVVGLPEAVFLYVNPAYEKGFGYTKDELLGKGTPDIYWDHAERDAILGMLKERGNVAQYEVRLKHKDGTMFWGLSSVRPITFNGKAALLGSFTDITGRKKVEAALHETRDYLENLIQYANAPIIVWDPSMRITRFNGGFERLTGYKAQEVLGNSLSMLFPEEGRDASLKIIRRALEGEYWEWVEIPILCKDGRIRLALWNSANIYAEDDATLVATIAQGTDITERKLAEEAVKQQAEELRRNNEELERFNRIAVDRELRMIELKKEVNDLLGLSGAPARYKTDFEKE